MKRPSKNKNDSTPRKKIKLNDTRPELENVPPIRCFNDLVKISRTIKLYKNIDSIMLWKISAQLEILNNLIGMESLKETLFYQILYYLQGMHLRNTSSEYLHTMIYGAPGCGKTTVAKIIGKIYKNLGIISPHGTFKIAYREDFIAGYLGQTAIKTQKLLNSCLGGVLFIDEVYALAPNKNDRDSFSKEAIDTLNVFLSEHKNDFCCIAAGYKENIENCFFPLNKGLQRRFPWRHYIQLYNSQELTDIFIKFVLENNWKIGVDKIQINKLIEQNQKLFVNTGGDIETFFTKCKIMHAKRVICLSQEHRFILIKKDIENALELFKKHKNYSEQNENIEQLYI